MDATEPRAGKYREQEYEQEYLLMVSRIIRGAGSVQVMLEGR